MRQLVSPGGALSREMWRWRHWSTFSSQILIELPDFNKYFNDLNDFLLISCVCVCVFFLKLASFPSVDAPARSGPWAFTKSFEEHRRDSFLLEKKMTQKSQRFSKPIFSSFSLLARAKSMRLAWLQRSDFRLNASSKHKKTLKGKRKWRRNQFMMYLDHI